MPIFQVSSAQSKILGKFMNGIANSFRFVHGLNFQYDANNQKKVSGYDRIFQLTSQIQELEYHRNNYEGYSPVYRPLDTSEILTKTLILDFFLMRSYLKLENNVLRSKEKEIRVYTYYSEKDQFAAINADLESIFGEFRYKNLMETIEKRGLYYVVKAITVRRSLAEKVENFRFFFTSSGKIYLYLHELGRGDFKITSHVVLIGTLNVAHFAKDRYKLRAFSLSKPKISLKFLENEIRINLYMKKAKKEKRDLSNVNVINSIHFVNKNQVGTLSEVCDGNVDTLLNNRILNEKIRLFIIRQMAKAVGQLHQIDIVHRDIKIDNFLYQKDRQGRIKKIKITDFGISSQITKDKRSTIETFYIPNADPKWSDPDVDDPFSKASDIYQLGIAICQVSINCSMSQWQSLRVADRMNLVEESQGHVPLDTLSLWKKHPDQWTGVASMKNPTMRKEVLQMVDPDPNKRPTIEEVILFLEQKKEDYCF
jgi:serine/threonine protein kinase